MISPNRSALLFSLSASSAERAKVPPSDRLPAVSEWHSATGKPKRLARAASLSSVRLIPHEERESPKRLARLAKTWTHQGKWKAWRPAKVVFIHIYIYGTEEKNSIEQPTLQNTMKIQHFFSTRTLLVDDTSAQWRSWEWSLLQHRINLSKWQRLWISCLHTKKHWLYSRHPSPNASISLRSFGVNFHS